MRDTFFSALENVFKNDPRMVYITGDLGYKLFDSLNEIAPDRVINVGIRESGMVGFAAGMARTGLFPVIYSIVPFITLRCLEQIKIDLCYNNAKVVIVGVGGGFSYGKNGPTHHGVDDLGVISCLPNITIWTPADSYEVRACVNEFPHLKGPAFLRLGRNKEPDIHRSSDKALDINNPIIIRDGEDGVMFTAGFLVAEAISALKILNKRKIFPKLVQIVTYHPFPTIFIRRMIGKSQPVMTIEEHVSNGGLGANVAMILAKKFSGNQFQMLSAPLEFPSSCMDRNALLRWAGLDSKSIAEAYEKLIS